MLNKNELINIVNNKYFKNFVLGCFLIICYLLIIPEFVILIFQIFNLDLKNESIYLLANFSIYLFTLAIIIFIYRKTIFKELKDFFKNFKSYSKTSFFYWLQGLIFMMITNSIIIVINNGLAANETGNREIIGALPIFSIISMAFLGPLIEELLFRKGFKDAFKNKIAFLIFTSLLFGNAHLLASFSPENFSFAQLLFIIPYSGFGFFFGKAYLETDNIFTSVFAHMIHNSLSVLLVLIGA